MNLPELILKGLLFGLALAMDAFSVSLANGLHDAKMCRSKALLIAGTFSFFQGAMPLIGWLCIHTVLEYFNAFSLAIPYIALALLLFIGGKMLYDGISEISEERKAALADGSCDPSESSGGCRNCNPPTLLGFGALLIQGVATSIDALSVGFDIAELSFPEALTEALVIAVSTFFICIAGVLIGKKFGTKLAGKATVLGGVILIAIGFEIFITGLLK